MTDEPTRSANNLPEADDRPNYQEFLILAEKLAELDDRLAAMAVVDLAAIYERLEQNEVAIAALSTSTDRSLNAQAELLSKLASDIRAIRTGVQELQQQFEAKLEDLEKSVDRRAAASEIRSLLASIVKTPKKNAGQYVGRS